MRGVSGEGVLSTELALQPENGSGGTEPFSGIVASGPAHDTASAAACPHCGGTRLHKHGFFSHKDGSRQQRYRCCGCGRTCNPCTGTPAANLKKRSQWTAMAARMFRGLPLRQTAARLGVHLSTAFRWRHRWLSARLGEEQPALAGPVAVATAAIRYSEKGSRCCRGPGSWGYWDWLRRGPRPDGVSPLSGYGERFRRFVQGRPVQVLLVRNGAQHAACVLGQKPAVGDCAGAMSKVLSGGAEVYGFSPDPSVVESCGRLGLPYQDGWQVLRERRGRTRQGEETRKPPVRHPESLHGWLCQFRGVATRYLRHYVTWFCLQMNWTVAAHR